MRLFHLKSENNKLVGRKDGHVSNKYERYLFVWLYNKHVKDVILSLIKKLCYVND